MYNSLEFLKCYSRYYVIGFFMGVGIFFVVDVCGGFFCVMFWFRR